jgi:hypothetical protein
LMETTMRFSMTPDLLPGLRVVFITSGALQVM